MPNLERLSELLGECIEDETGIKVQTDDFTYKEDSESFYVLLFGEEFAEINLDYLEDADDLAYLIIDSVDKLRKMVIENRIEYLETVIRKKLSEASFDRLSIKNRGYLSRSRHYTVDEETEQDYPELVLVVEAGSVVYEFEVNPYDVSEPVDMKELQRI